MTDARLSQVALSTPTTGDPNAQISQLAVVAVTEEKAQFARLSQVAVVALVEGPATTVAQLNVVFKLQCFVPCVPFGVRRY